MNILHFRADLKADVIFSERSATTGGHTTLDYIPGAALLGAARRADALGGRAQLAGPGEVPRQRAGHQPGAGGGRA